MMVARRLYRPEAKWLLLAGVMLFGMSMAQPPQKGSPRTTYFSIETGSSTGSNFSVGSTLATILSNPPGSVRCQIRTACGPPGLIAVALTSPGTVANARDVALQRVESALVPANIAVAAYQGRDAFKNDGPYKNLRAIGKLYPEAIQLVVAKGRGIKTLAELKGRVIAIDAEGTQTNTTAIAVLTAAGIPRKAVKLMDADADRAADLLAARRIDGFFMVANAPAEVVTRLTDRVAIDLVPLGAATIKMLDRLTYQKQTIPSATYKGTSATETASVGMLWLVSAHADEGLIHQLTAALWDDANASYFQGFASPRALRDAVSGVPIPLHPGAERYYRERGLLPALRTEAAKPR